MMKKTLNQIDPALSLMGEFSKINCGTTQKIQQMRQDVIFKDGHLPAKLKALIAALWGVSARVSLAWNTTYLKLKN